MKDLNKFLSRKYYPKLDEKFFKTRETNYIILLSFKTRHDNFPCFL